MLSLELPHAEFLNDEDNSEEESDDDDSDYRAALGTRPPLPDLPAEGDYSDVVAVFLATTEAEPKRRPKASDIIRILEEKTLPTS